jgi:hypothetical protein
MECIKMNTTTREGFLMNTSRRIPRQLVKALAAGAVLFAAALPLVVASAAGAATLTAATFTPHNGTFATPNEIGTGASGAFSIAGSGFAGDGSTTTVTSTAPGLTFSGVTEAVGGATVSGSFTSTSATVPGTYTLTVTDDTGASTSTTTAGGVVVDANATITTVTPATPVTQANGAPAATTATLVTIAGSGFVSGATVTFQNTTDGTTLASADTAGHIVTGIASAGDQGLAITTGTTSIAAYVSPTNSITGATEAAGTYTVTVTNPDGGTTVDAGALTVLPYGVFSVTPSAIVGVATLTNTVVTIAGAGFEPGATVTLAGCTEANGTLATSSVVSATAITATVPETGAGAAELCSVTVHNPTILAGGNNATFVLAGGLGISGPSTVAPTITATNATATSGLVPGAAATTVTLTGTGFSQYSSAAAFVGTSATAGGVTLNNPVGNTGTSITFNVLAVSGATAGPFNVVVSNTAAASNAFPAAVSVVGPVITSQTPVGLAVGSPVGTVVTLTGTGFTNTDTGTVTDAGAGALQGIFTYVNATTMNLVITVSPVAGDQVTPPSVVVSQSPGPSVSSPSFKLKIDAAPLVTGSLTYAAGTDVGVGAVAQAVTINGSGFATGVTIGSFINGNSVADPDVTATVTSINLAGTQIKATIAIKAGDTNIADGYSVTNTDGGVAKVPAGLSALVIGAGPTITSVSPAAATPSGTTAFTITGTGFQTGASVAASSDGTCGSAAVVSATSITVSCTLGAASATPVTLAVTNVDGGSANSAAVLTASVPKVTGPHATHVNGSAVTGKTVTITISGSGFAGAPKITSNAAGTTAKVTHDTGKLLTVRISTKAGKGEHTLTIRNANGKSCKINYATKA